MSNKIKQFYYKKSRIQQLKGFCYTVQEGSSLSASKKMGLDPSTISLQIKSLEDDLGVKLFDREGKKLVLNEKGKALYEKAVHLIQESDKIFEDFLLAEDKNFQNTLKIAGFDMVISELVKYIAVFQKENPKVKISLLNIPKSEAIDGLIKREIDMAIYPFWFTEIEEVSSELEAKEIAKYKSYWVMHKDHPLAKKDEKDLTKHEIANGNFAYIPEMVNMKNFRNFIDEYNIKNKINIVNGNLDILKKMIENNMCMSIITGSYLTKEDKKKFVLKSTENLFPHRIYACVFNKNIKKITEKFFDEIEDEIKKFKIFK